MLKESKVMVSRGWGGGGRDREGQVRRQWGNVEMLAKWYEFSVISKFSI